MNKHTRGSFVSSTRQTGLPLRVYCLSTTIKWCKKKQKTRSTKHIRTQLVPFCAERRNSTIKILMRGIKVEEKNHGISKLSVVNEGKMSE